MKTQKSFRKKALLSSVAMLLVATVAVGSATFAWFSQNTTAKANGVNVKTVKASNIVLCATNSPNDSDWVSTLDLNIANKQLFPVSTADLSNWYQTKATKFNTKATDEGGRGTISPVETANAGGYYVAKQFFVKSIGEDITASYTVNVTPTAEDGAATNLDYVRAALADKDGNASSFYGNKAADTACITSDGKTGGTQTITTSAITGDLSLKKDEGQSVTVYIWFEGEDPECVDSAAGVDVSLEVNFAKK